LHSASNRASVGSKAQALWAVSSLLFNAMVWGLSWWPMRQLQAAGLHPLWSTALIFALITLCLSAVRPRAWREVLTQPALWLILLASGVTNAAFNWGVTVGDVVRVVLLFYLMPLWMVLLAWLMLGERPTRAAMLRVGLAVSGAMVVLWPADGQGLGGWSLVDGLGLLGGMSFAFTSVMLRREAQRSDATRGLAMFAGGVVVATLLALNADVPRPPLAQLSQWWPWVALLSLGFLAGNLSFQYGASRLAGSATAVVMLTEVLWASGSALALGAGSLTPALALGGGLIVSAAVLAAWQH
jgi:drug/metabolite transporter (DMT)-like permease